MKKKDHSHKDHSPPPEGPQVDPEGPCLPGDPPVDAGEGGPAPAAGVDGGTEVAPAAQGPGDGDAALKAQCDDYLKRLQRVSADFLNYQKRVQKEIAYKCEFANEELIRSLLPALDDMDRALEAAKADNADRESLLKGMELVRDKLTEALGNSGLDAVDAEGKPFDPENHSAVLQQPSDRHPPNTVIKQLQKGYRLKGRTIRPAAVIVSQKPGAPKADDQAKGQG